jgi:pyruvate/2-oxoglutarate dehydrogenase complex dihydrolipoamide acyltransferase (E2) component
MPTEILMPALSPTMEEGKLAKWLVEEGQTVKAGDVIAEIETDKATMEVEASDEGKVSKLLVPAGTEGVKVNTPIALLDGEDAAPAKASPSAKKGTGSPSPLVGEGQGGGDRRTSAVGAPPPPTPPPQAGGGNRPGE